LTTKRETRSVPKSEARQVFLKAEEFLAGASASLDAARWNTAGLDAIHAGLAAADAAMIALVGHRSASRDHGDALELLAKSSKSFAAAQRRQFGGLLKMKNAVAYEQRLLNEVEARKLVDHAVRFVGWARGIVEKQGG
jgi:hypothetical protein